MLKSFIINAILFRGENDKFFSTEAFLQLQLMGLNGNVNMLCFANLAGFLNSGYQMAMWKKMAIWNWCWVKHRHFQKCEQYDREVLAQQLQLTPDKKFPIQFALFLFWTYSASHTIESQHNGDMHHANASYQDSMWTGNSLGDTTRISFLCVGDRKPNIPIPNSDQFLHHGYLRWLLIQQPGDFCLRELWGECPRHSSR